MREHQVRKQYKKVIWSAAIIENDILCWRRKGAGLQGFQADNAIRNRTRDWEEPLSGFMQILFFFFFLFGLVGLICSRLMLLVEVSYQLHVMG